ncbi:uncharacterized protein TRIADDRAFT_53081 [Trichoplax adhaerens]|uniref:Ras-GEF domain-containing protein n=1 Tax=Trichoplax adhaerens TaxID=10228 RepID=B3RN90_TRIAD|nr:hypothetical protein TRIADDRAFT_53081 [Trichoplax adhaerens]EDV27411.1 hypothetical protein TRIADDRAFT_53081 [Trichoplax adhaerens]|eukprot:XP_002109245.1 hypothetical protein TRIADDRAFT_53081 [Trichoplax adhaerens]
MARKLRYKQSLPFILQDRKVEDNPSELDNSVRNYLNHLSNFDSTLLKSKYDGIAYDSVVFDILMESPERLAAQITLLDIGTFKLILPEELLGCAWTKRDKKLYAPHVTAMAQRFNSTCFWVQNEILSKKKARIRAEVICWFTKLAKKLFELNNLHALKAVVSGLQSAPIYRLHRTWTFITRKDRSALDKLLELLAEHRNNEKLREYMKNLRNPAIPYLGLYLTDLMFIYAAYNKPANELGESDKISTKINNIIRIIASYQDSNYDTIETVPYIQEYLKSFKYIEELQNFLEAEYYRKSLDLEPEQIESVSGINCEASHPGLQENKLDSEEMREKDTTITANLKHPLDDSILADHKPIIDSDKSINSILADKLSYTSLHSACDAQIVSPWMNFSMQGCLRKMTYLKRGQKLRVTRWKTYWVALLWTKLYFYERKFNRSGNERSAFKSEFCKCYDISGWLMVLGDYHSPHMIYLCNIEEGNKYKLDAKTAENSSIWLRFLLDASTKQNFKNVQVQLND